MNIYERLRSMVYVSQLIAQGIAVTDDDQRIRASGLYEDWQAGSYQVGDIRNAVGQTWECFQAHDNATYPDIIPDNPAWFTFWRPLHGKSPETARPFVPVQGAHDMYRSGEYMLYTDGLIYRCTQDTAYSPTDYAEAWEVYNPDATTDPAEPSPEEPDEPEQPSIPDFVQPTGPDDAYNTGDKVMFNGSAYESLIDNNVWSPSEYPQGWQLISQ